MPPNMLVSTDDKKQSTKFRSIQDIMNNPALKAKLNNAVDEAVRTKQRIFEEQLTIKTLRETALNDVGLNPKLFNYYVSMVFNNDYAARSAAVGELETLIDTVMALLPASNSNFQNGPDED